MYVYTHIYIHIYTHRYDVCQQYRNFVLRNCIDMLQQERQATLSPCMRARALYAILKSVVEMHPITCSTVLVDKKNNRSTCIRELQEQYSIIDNMISELRVLALANSASSALLTPSSVLSKDTFRTQREGGGGSSTALLSSELWTRLEILRFLLEQSDVKLSVEQVGKLWEALETYPEALMRWLRLVCDAGSILTRPAEEQIFSLLLGAAKDLLNDTYGFDCFCSYFADVNSARSLLECVGRDGASPGKRLCGYALVGRRVAIRRYDNKKMQSAMVTRFEKGALNGYVICWDSDGEEDKKDLVGDGTEWTLMEEESGANSPVCVRVCVCVMCDKKDLVGDGTEWALIIHTNIHTTYMYAYRYHNSHAAEIGADYTHTHTSTHTYTHNKHTCIQVPQFTRCRDRRS